jgi:hypothetical protein
VFQVAEGLRRAARRVVQGHPLGELLQNRNVHVQDKGTEMKSSRAAKGVAADEDGIAQILRNNLAIINDERVRIYSTATTSLLVLAWCDCDRDPCDDSAAPVPDACAHRRRVASRGRC